MTRICLPREMPDGLGALTELAVDLRWTWTHAGDALWRMLDADAWDNTKNPWLLLQDVPLTRLEELSRDETFRKELARLERERQEYGARPGYFEDAETHQAPRNVAYFSMEFGLGEALPLYAGGLGILAGDYLKAASDVGVPVIAVGLLYQEGYFRQLIDASGWQQEVYPYNEPTSLPIQPVLAESGGWLHITLHMPGRDLLLRVWRAQVGRVSLYLLDSNDPLNSPVDRGVTGKLYGGGPEMRLMQEIVLGVGGWRLLGALGIEADVCHLNEGHAAFAIVERIRTHMVRHGVDFHEALWATRAGNIFTTHTPVDAGFDRFAPELIDKYFAYFRDYVQQLGVDVGELLALGRRNPSDAREPFNMAYLALRGCARVNGVSALHGAVSRDIFQPLYPRWPMAEVPVGHVTNGVHVPSWDSPWSDRVWTEACGKGRWRGPPREFEEAIGTISDEDLWALCADERRDLVRYARERLARHLGQRGADPDAVTEARTVLDPNALTIGFARRFTEYKRPHLLLKDTARLTRLLTDTERPVQLIIAGKAHPADQWGKRSVQQWMEFVNRPEVRHRAVFLEDYDIALAQELVQGVDLWINTPRRPMEACGTSGMKVLVNGGLNLSELDGWWAEAFAPEVGWTLSDDHPEARDTDDEHEAERLYRTLENDIVPCFYDRDAAGVPRGWIARVRASMARLAPQFSTNRMLAEYADQWYVPAARDYAARCSDQDALAKELRRWHERLAEHWDKLHLGPVETAEGEGGLRFEVPVYLGELSPEDVQVELYAEATGSQPRSESNEGADGAGPVRVTMTPAAPIAGAVQGFVYRGEVSDANARGRAPEDFTARIVPHHPAAHVPGECHLILWQH